MVRTPPPLFIVWKLAGLRLPDASAMCRKVSRKKRASPSQTNVWMPAL